MLTQRDLQQLAKVVPDATREDHRARYRAWREVLHIYEDAVIRAASAKHAPEGEDFAELREEARKAFTVLGGMAEPGPASLSRYDHDRYGPFLGVSDGGSAAERIRDAFLKSPKALAHGKPEPLVVGGSVDAERLGGSGEVPVGPDEYREIQLAAVGRVLTTTNVGTRVNARYYNDPPQFAIFQRRKEEALKTAIAKATALLAPFLRTPDGKPRPVTLFVSFGRYVAHATQADVLRGLLAAMRLGAFCDSGKHRLGLLVRAPRGDRGITVVHGGLAIAARAGVDQVAINGVLRREAQERLSLPGLLNFFEKDTANDLWAKAHSHGIALRAWKSIDVDSVARNTWTSLQTARSAGVCLGKYGMLPLTVQEADYVIGKIQSWFYDWSAAPAIYVDCPTVTNRRCYDEEAAEAVRIWLDVAHKHKVGVVLIDTADKSRGRRLLKEGPGDEEGLLTESEIRRLNAYALKRGIRALWAGGISAAQAFRFGKLGVFGIYTTTSTARKVAVSGDLAHDPSMPNEKEPTYCGVYRVAMLLQAGFVLNGLRRLGEAELAGKVETGAEALIASSPGGDGEHEIQRQLSQSLQTAWRRLL